LGIPKLFSCLLQQLQSFIQFASDLAEIVWRICAHLLSRSDGRQEKENQRCDGYVIPHVPSVKGAMKQAKCDTAKHFQQLSCSVASEAKCLYGAFHYTFVDKNAIGINGIDGS
jgi:hypothetical protein